MRILSFKYRFRFIMLAAMACADLACQKSTTAPSVEGVAAFSVINAIPNTVNNIIPVINTSQAIMWFQTANSIPYGGFYEYSPIGGNDTVYVVQSYDTLDVNSKSNDQMFYGILTLKEGGIYSLFLCGTDTTSPDYLFTADTLPYHNSSDSVVGIRFVNLSAGSNPISINVEGSPNGSEVGSLSYKGITSFKEYFSNSATSNTGFLFVFRDVTSGDSLTSFYLPGRRNGLVDPNSNSLLTFKNITIALYGSENDANIPLNTMLIDDF